MKAWADRLRWKPRAGWWGLPRETASSPFSATGGEVMLKFGVAELVQCAKLSEHPAIDVRVF